MLLFNNILDKYRTKQIRSDNYDRTLASLQSWGAGDLIRQINTDVTNIGQNMLSAFDDVMVSKHRNPSKSVSQCMERYVREAVAVNQRGYMQELNNMLQVENPTPCLTVDQGDNIQELNDFLRVEVPSDVEAYRPRPLAGYMLKYDGYGRRLNCLQMFFMLMVVLIGSFILVPLIMHIPIYDDNPFLTVFAVVFCLFGIAKLLSVMLLQRCFGTADMTKISQRLFCTAFCIYLYDIQMDLFQWLNQNYQTIGGICNGQND